MAQLKTGRDPFARGNVCKRKVAGLCDWCGYGRRIRGLPTDWVWQYYWVDDQGPRHSHDIKGKFCSIGCLNSYHG